MSVAELLALNKALARSRAPAVAAPATWTHVGLLACILLLAVPILTAELPPLFDYPNHLARVYIIRHQADLAGLGDHYELASFFVPNVLADLFLLGAMRVLDVYAAGKLLLLAIAALTVSGAYVLNRAATGRWSGWPLLAAALVFNEMFFWGFLNYLLGVALLLWALAIWMLLEQRSRRLQIAAGTAFALAVMAAHLVAFGLYAVAILVLEVVRLARRRAVRPRAAARRLGGSLLQLVPALALYVLVSPSSDLPLNLRFDFSWWGKLSPLTRLLASGHPALDIASLAVVLGLVGIGLATRRISFHAGLGLAAAIYLLLVLTLPYSALGSFFLDSRIAIAFALVAVAAIRPRRGTGAGRTATAVLLALVAVRSAVLAQDWKGQHAEIEPVREVLRALPPGSLLVPASETEFELGDWIVTRQERPAAEHMATLATIDAGVLVPNVFARRGQNPLVFAPRIEEMQPLGRNPISRVFGVSDLRELTAQAALVLERAAETKTKLPGVFIVAHHVRCHDWPEDLPVRIVACGGGYSLVQVDTAPMVSAMTRSPGRP